MTGGVSARRSRGTARSGARIRSTQSATVSGVLSVRSAVGRRVADQAGGAADERERPVARPAGAGAAVSSCTRLPRCRLGAVGSKPAVEASPARRRAPRAARRGRCSAAIRPRHCRSSRMSAPVTVGRVALGGSVGRASACPAGVRRRRGAAGRYGRHGRLAVDPEPPRATAPSPATPTRGPVRTVAGGPARPAGRAAAAATRVEQVGAVVRRRSRPSALRQPGRAAGELARRVAPSAAGRGQRRRPSTTSPARSSTADGRPRRPADDVHAPVHAVGEVDVEVARRAEHHRVARRCGPR